MTIFSKPLDKRLEDIDYQRVAGKVNTPATGEPHDDGIASDGAPGGESVPAFEGAENSDDDHLPGSEEGRLLDEGGEDQGDEDNNHDQRSSTDEAAERRSAGTNNTGVPAGDGQFGATTRSGRRVRVPVRMRESIDQRDRRWVAWIANALQGPELLPEDEIYEVLANREYDIQDRASDPIYFSATSDQDTMYWHQAMQQPDKH
jgi:hypothetical protein